ncbi:LPS-assembly protein LptD [Spirochaeta cellobiosiphila]|uniref:LPS-assembly protein LptD n=1 Tax=Spirochaeta cellobiosiphila TaxID=504483 RepID=UPI0004051D96|nr:LPS-assembly protein LptD [Spirochaeta cellobiosiphila]
MRRIILLALIFAGFGCLWSQDLFTDTLAKDIDTARYREVVNWLSQLGLSTEGSLDTMKSRLSEYYNIEESDDINSLEDMVSIERADFVEYFSIPEKNENYLRLVGQVKLVLNQEAEDQTHTIEAQEILYNQQKNLLYGKGNVSYTLTKKDGTENFTGSRLFFNVDTWSGRFIDGGSNTSTKNSYNEELDYFYTADTIRRTKDDVIILNNITRSSSIPEEPYYKIKASKVWILTPDEWAILNGVLYIGEIPVFYIPFYFKPGDEMLFNPVIGTDSTEGFFFYTTYYIYGQKETSSSSFSFLKVQEDSDSKEFYEYVRHGLYLQRTSDVLPKDDLRRTQYWKFYGDMTNKTLASFGSVGIFDAIPHIHSLSYYEGIAFSHDLDSTGIPFDYTRQIYDQPFQTGWFWNTDVPFRYLFSIDLKILENITLKVEAASDPDFPEDFLDRNENFEFLNLFGFDQLEKDYSTKDDERSYKFSSYVDSTSKFETLEWSIKSSFEPNVTKFNPWLSSLSVSDFNTKLLWSYDDKKNYKDSYYYPNSLKWTSLSASLGGALFPYKAASSKGSEVVEDGDIIPPWGNKGETTEEANTSEIQDEEDWDPIIPPSYLGPININSSPEYDYRPQLSYKMKGLNYDLTSVYTDPSGVPGEIEFDEETRRSVLSASSIALIIDQSLGPFGSVSNSLDFMYSESKYLYLNEDTLTSSKIKSYKEDDYSDSTRYLTDALSVSTTPYPLYTDWTVNYQWKGIIFDREFDDDYYDTNQEVRYDWQTLQFTDDYILKHLVGSQYAYYLPYSDIKSSLSYEKNLPPQAEEDSFDTTTKWGQRSLSVTVSQDGDKKEEEDWILDPLSVQLAYEPFSYLTFAQDVRYNWEEEDWDTLIYSIDFFRLEALYKMKRDYHYDVDINASNGPLITRDKKKFQPVEASLGLNTAEFKKDFLGGRISLGGKIDFTADLYLNNFIDSASSLNTSLSFDIVDFLRVRFKTSSSNNSLYRYVPYYYKQINGSMEEYTSPIEDILTGFAFGNTEKRKSSQYKIDSLNLSIDHYMPDWVLSFALDSTPIEKEDGTGWKFSNEFVIQLRWKPHQEFHSVIEQSEDDGFEFKTQK